MHDKASITCFLKRSTFGSADFFYSLFFVLSIVFFLPPFMALSVEKMGLWSSQRVFIHTSGSILLAWSYPQFWTSIGEIY